MLFCNQCRNVWSITSTLTYSMTPFHSLVYDLRMKNTCCQQEGVTLRHCYAKCLRPLTFAEQKYSSCMSRQVNMHINGRLLRGLLHTTDLIAAQTIEYIIQTWTPVTYSRVCPGRTRSLTSCRCLLCTEQRVPIAPYRWFGWVWEVTGSWSRL